MNNAYLVSCHANGRRVDYGVYASEETAKERVAVMKDMLNGFIAREVKSNYLSLEDFQEISHDDALWKEAESIFGEIVHKTHLTDMFIKIEPIAFYP